MWALKIKEVQGCPVRAGIGPRFPDAILKAEDGNVFLIKGEQFIVERIQQCLVLSKLDKDYGQDGTQYLWCHFRDNTYRSLLTQDEVYLLLKTNSFIIY